MPLAEMTLADGGVIAGLMVAIGVVFKLLIASKDKQIADAESRAASYEEISSELLEVAEEKLIVKGTSKPKVPKLAKVVPEHNSPTTLRQRRDAALQTCRARVVALKLALDMPAREESPNGDEP